MKSSNSILCMVVIILVALLFFGGTGWCFEDDELEPLGTTVQYKNTVSGTSSFTVPAGRVVVWAFSTIEGGNIRYFYDKTTPGGQYGHVGGSGEYVSCLAPDEVTGFRWTMDLASSGVTVTTTFFGKK